jgi:hypothetical protein
MSTTLNAESFAEINIRKRTTLDAAAAAAATTLTVASTEGLSAGQPIFVGTPGRDGCEGATINAIADATHLTLTAGTEPAPQAL